MENEKRHQITVSESTYQRLQKPLRRPEANIIMLLNTKSDTYDYSDSNGIFAEFAGIPYKEVEEWCFTNDTDLCFKHLFPKIQKAGFIITITAFEHKGYEVVINPIFNNKPFTIHFRNDRINPAVCGAIMEYIKMQFPDLYAKRIEPMWR